MENSVENMKKAETAKNELQYTNECKSESWSQMKL